MKHQNKGGGVEISAIPISFLSSLKANNCLNFYNTLYMYITGRRKMLIKLENNKSFEELSV